MGIPKPLPVNTEAEGYLESLQGEMCFREFRGRDLHILNARAKVPRRNSQQRREAGAADAATGEEDAANAVHPLYCSSDGQLINEEFLGGYLGRNSRLSRFVLEGTAGSAGRGASFEDGDEEVLVDTDGAAAEGRGSRDERAGEKSSADAVRGSLSPRRGGEGRGGALMAPFAAAKTGAEGAPPPVEANAPQPLEELEAEEALARRIGKIRRQVLEGKRPPMEEGEVLELARKGGNSGNQAAEVRRRLEAQRRQMRTAEFRKLRSEPEDFEKADRRINSWGQHGTK